MGIRDLIYFEVTAFHLALLKRLDFQEGEGVPEVSAKRPYGDSDVISDLQKIYSETMGYEVLRLRDEGTIVIQGDRVISRGDGSGSVEDDIEVFSLEEPSADEHGAADPHPQPGYSGGYLQPRALRWKVDSARGLKNGTERSVARR